MLTKLEADKKYRCIDLEGYLKSYVGNKYIWDEYSTDGCYIINYVDSDGEGWSDGGFTMVITSDEIKFFELVEDDVWEPTAGEQCLVRYAGKWYKTFIVGKNSSGEIVFEVTPDMEEDAGERYDSYLPSQLDKFKPLPNKVDEISKALKDLGLTDDEISAIIKAYSD